MRYYKLHLNVTHHPSNGLKYSTQRLLTRMLSPICGMNPELFVLNRARQSAHMIMATANLTGVHLLNGTPEPKKGSYHIGGGGIYPDEAIIRVLGESVERHAQFTIMRNKQYDTLFASYDVMVKRNEPLLPKETLNHFSKQQLARPGFPFQAFKSHLPCTWIRVQSLTYHHKIWIPIQFLLLCYQVKRHLSEPRIACAVTTGTATHITPILALRSALLELVQIDSTMGHWYTNTPAVRIILDDRTRALENLLVQYRGVHSLSPTFYALVNPDLPGMYVACVLEQSVVPKVAIGLGGDTRLIDAMYKAYIEACCSFHLAKTLLLNEKLGMDDTLPSDPSQMYDLDSNFAFYAKGGNTKLLAQKFSRSPAKKASKFPMDMEGDAPHQVQQLIDAFRQSNKELISMDLTTMEARALGLVVSRVWSPNTLSLSLPSSVQSQHPRFKAYGGITHDAPHPYP